MIEHELRSVTDTDKARELQNKKKDIQCGVAKEMLGEETGQEVCDLQFSHDDDMER